MLEDDHFEEPRIAVPDGQEYAPFPYFGLGDFLYRAVGRSKSEGLNRKKHPGRN
jgi:hypothetical protein